MKHFRIAGALALALSAAACMPAATVPVASPAAVGQVAAALAATPPGQYVLTWAQGLAANAKASLAKDAAGAGLTPADIANLCAMDNTAHSAVQLIELVPVLPSTVAPVDDAAHAAVQTACAVAQGGTAPAAGDLGAIASEAAALIADLKL